jgi:hypothetical protein
MAVNDKSSPIKCNMHVEELLPWFGWTASASVYEGKEPQEPYVTSPTSIIQTHQPWCVCFDWKTWGSLTYNQCGKWVLEVLLEQMGKAEFSLSDVYPAANTSVAYQSKPYTYHHCIEFPPNIVPAGVYRLVVTISMISPSGRPCPIAAFGDCGLLRFYESRELVE